MPEELCKHCNHSICDICTKDCLECCQKKGKPHCVNPLCKVWKANQLTDKQIKKGK